MKKLVAHYSENGRGAIFDEAYEFFCDPQPESAIRYVDDIEKSDIFVAGAATKGLQVPGMRVGWIIAASRQVEIFRNYSSFGMGGVSRASQLYVTELLEPQRVAEARQAVCNYYTSQRHRYRQGLEELGFELSTGDGGFYHWGKLPGGLSSDEFNSRLFQHEAGILPGVLCDMLRREGPDGPMHNYVRFSFGPLGPDSYDDDMAILRQCV